MFSSQLIDDVDYFLKDYIEGKTTTMKSYTSSTKGETYNPEANIQMFIKSKTGKDISKYNVREQEVLFRRNTKFKTIIVERDGFYANIYLK